jgi:hypothetical protein
MERDLTGFIDDAHPAPADLTHDLEIAELLNRSALGPFQSVASL